MVSNVSIKSMAKISSEYETIKDEKQVNITSSKSKKNTNKRTYTYVDVTLGEGQFLTNDIMNTVGEAVRIITTDNKKLVEEDYNILKEYAINHNLISIDLSQAYSDFIPDELLCKDRDSYLDVEEFKFPKGVKTIGNYAFYNCTSLIGTLELPETVTTIGNYAFTNCTELSGDLVIPDSVISIGEYAFDSCYSFDRNLIIGSLVQYIGESAFTFCFCNNAVMKIDCDSDMSIKESVFNELSSYFTVTIEIPYSFDKNGTWIETSSARIAQVSVTETENEIEVSIPSIYQISSISATKNGQGFTLPEKNSDNKYILEKEGLYEITMISNLGTTKIVFGTNKVEDEDNEFEEVRNAVNNAVQTGELSDIEYARNLVNALPECDVKAELQRQLNEIELKIGFVKKNATANVDIYIKAENMLKLSLSTNSISFDDFSGVTDIFKPNTLKLTVSSSLPYQVDAYLATEIQNADKSKTMDKEILKIKANEKDESEYASFSDVNNTPITLLDEQDADNDVVHGIDFKLVGGDAFEKDVYKTTIKFEVKQK